MKIYDFLNIVFTIIFSVGMGTAVYFLCWFLWYSIKTAPFMDEHGRIEKPEENHSTQFNVSNDYKDY